MSKKDIKSKNKTTVAQKNATTKNTVKTNTIPEKKDHQANVKVKKIPWKLAMRVSFIAGEKIKPKNDEEKAYLKILEEKKEKYDIKSKALIEKIKLKSSKIIENANKFADRVIDKIIDRDAQKEKFKAVDDKNKEVAKNKVLEKAKLKRERKKAKQLAISKSIPTKDDIKTVKKRQEELDKQYQEKLEKAEAENEARAKVREKRKEIRKEKMEKRAINKLHHKEKTFAKKLDKIERKPRKVKKEEAKGPKIPIVGQPQKDVHTTAKKAIEKINAENKKVEARVKQQKEKKAKAQAVELKQQNKTKSDFKRFLESEKKRIEKKALVAAKYGTKGANPKVNTNVVIDYTAVFLDKDKKEIKERIKRKRLPQSNVKNYSQRIFDKLSKKDNFFKLIYSKSGTTENAEIIYKKAA